MFKVLVMHMYLPKILVGVLLHGLLGHKGNWLKFVRQLCERNPSLKILLVDLRNHGDSTLLQVFKTETPAHLQLPGEGPNTVHECSKDIIRLCCSLDVKPDFVVGHSFGGKVASLVSEGLRDIERTPKQVEFLL